MKRILDWLNRKEEIKPSALAERDYFIQNFKLNEEEDIEEVLEYLKIGTTIALLKFENPEIIYSNMTRVKELCKEIDGDILGLTKQIFLAVPKNFRIVRKDAKENFIRNSVKEEDFEEDEWVDVSLR